MRALLTLICALALALCNKLVAASPVRKPYIVSYDGAVDEICDALESTTKHMNFHCLWHLKIKCRRRMRFARLFAVFADDKEVNALRTCVPALDFEEDVEVFSQGVTTWSRDRLNGRDGLDGKLLPRDPPEDGYGSIVHVYLLDTGVRRTHVEFKDQVFGRGVDLVDDDAEPDDCDGHGSHVASTINQIAYSGKTVLPSVRVLDCNGNGELSGLIEGLEWVLGVATPSEPAVVSLALGVRNGIWSRALERVVQTLTGRGVFIVCAAGNQKGDACTISPGNVAETLTVAASDQADAPYAYGNSGRCVDLFAPGVQILGACGGSTACEHPSDTAYAFQSGTSMAVAHAVGAATRLLMFSPRMSPENLKKHLTSTASRDKIRGGSLLPGTPNLLLYVK